MTGVLGVFVVLSAKNARRVSEPTCEPWWCILAGLRVPTATNGSAYKKMFWKLQKASVNRPKTEALDRLLDGHQLETLFSK